jgi:hypothetical protein
MVFYIWKTPRRMAGHKTITADTAGGEKSMKRIAEMTEDEYCKLYFETVLAVQEWGTKNNLRLFGIEVAEVNDPVANGNLELRPQAKAIFTDTGFKSMIIRAFDTKETGGKVAVSKSKRKAIKWPIKFARTKWESQRIDPVSPLYRVLVDRGIILPFRSTLKVKEWVALPFEDMSGIKSTEI